VASTVHSKSLDGLSHAAATRNDRPRTMKTMATPETSFSLVCCSHLSLISRRNGRVSKITFYSTEGSRPLKISALFEQIICSQIFFQVRWMPRSPWQESYREADFNGHVQPTRSFIFPRLRNPITQFILLSAVSSITLFADFLSIFQSPRNLDPLRKTTSCDGFEKLLRYDGFEKLLRCLSTGSINFFDVMRRVRCHAIDK
jgi:hypothetical protein